MSGISLNLVLLLVAAYVLGSIPFGLLIARLFGEPDVRRAGSGNIGATNVSRVAGPAAGLITLLCDAGKGAAAVWLAARVANENGGWMMAAGLAALLGHCFSIWLGFRGGKGVATAAGVFLMLCPAAAGGAALLFFLFVAYWRYVSLGSLAAATATPFLIYVLWAPHHAPPHSVTLGTLAAAALIVGKHGGNIRRLMTGSEPKFRFGGEEKEDK